MILSIIQQKLWYILPNISEYSVILILISGAFPIINLQIRYSLVNPVRAELAKIPVKI